MKYLEIEYKYELTQEEYNRIIANEENGIHYAGSDYFIPLTARNFIRYREGSNNFCELTVKKRLTRSLVTRDEVNLSLGTCKTNIEDINQFFKVAINKTIIGKLTKIGYYKKYEDFIFACYAVFFPNGFQTYFIEFETLEDSFTSEQELKKQVNKQFKKMKLSKRTRINKSLYDLLLENQK